VREPDYAAPEAWAAGADRVYETLSIAALADLGPALSGRRVLDLGAGTGATSRALVALGAFPVALDASWPMLEHRRASRPTAIVADGTAIAVGDDAVDATVAAFVLSHVTDPVALLREVGRVTRENGMVVVVSFAATGMRSTATIAVDDVLRRRGWEQPAWYRRLKEELEPSVADPEQLVSLARTAGLRAPEVATRVVDTGVDRADELVAWRLGNPGAAAFVDELPAGERRALRAEAIEAVGPSPQPLVLDLRVLSSRAPTARASASA
jgi:ubiquinone/menaquinone biosynthesis C-methylase UbiE